MIAQRVAIADQGNARECEGMRAMKGERRFSILITLLLINLINLPISRMRVLSLNLKKFVSQSSDLRSCAKVFESLSLAYRLSGGP